MRIASAEFKRGEINAKALKAREAAFVEKLGIPVSAATLKALISIDYNKDAQDKIIRILTSVMEKGLFQTDTFLRLIRKRESLSVQSAITEKVMSEIYLISLMLKRQISRCSALLHLFSRLPIMPLKMPPQSSALKC